MNRFVCQNCGHICGQEDMHRTVAQISGAELAQRVAPGEPMPGGECPMCKSLMQPCLTKFGCLLVFKEGISRKEVEHSLGILAAGSILDHEPVVNEFDPTSGDPTWYIP